MSNKGYESHNGQRRLLYLAEIIGWKRRGDGEDLVSDRDRTRGALMHLKGRFARLYNALQLRRNSIFGVFFDEAHRLFRLAPTRVNRSKTPTH